MNNECRSLQWSFIAALRDVVNPVCAIILTFAISCCSGGAVDAARDITQSDAAAPDRRGPGSTGNADGNSDGVFATGRRVRVAAISFAPRPLDLQLNSDTLESAFREAAAGKAQIAAAPEGVLDGYTVNQSLDGELPEHSMRQVAVTIDDPVIRRFQDLSRSLSLCLVFGFAERVGEEIFNTAVFIDHEGNISGRYHKMQLAEGYHPDWWFNRLGATSRAFDTPFGRCGILICNDRWNPALARIPALDGAQFLVIPSYGSCSRKQDDAVLSRSRENGIPVIEANVGVSLITSENEIVALRRGEDLRGEKPVVTFADVIIPTPIAARPEERDNAEREFLEWRGREMPVRYQKRIEEHQKKKIP